jgi:hypothetical protein
MFHEILKALLLGVSMAASAMAWAEEVALITQVSGEVSIETGTSKHAAQPMQKVHLGDRMLLNAGKVQLAFFSSAMQETWDGTGRLELGTGSSTSTTLKAQTRQLPALLVKQLQRTPSTSKQDTKAGMLVMRSAPRVRSVESIHQDYLSAKKALPEGDFTADIAYVNELIAVKAYTQVHAFVAALKGQAGAADIAKHFAQALKTLTGETPSQ